MKRLIPLLLTLGLVAATQEAEHRRLTELLSPSVVAVRSQEGYGTGILLDNQGLILTNAHVIISPTPLKVEVEGSGAFQKVTLMGVHPKMDLALLKIDPSERKAKLVPIKIAKSRALGGEPVYAMGYPSTGGGQRKILTPCKMVGNDRFADRPGYQEFLGDVHPGNSGGPLCNLQGEALGLVTLGYEDGSLRAYAVSILNLKTDDFVPLSRRESNPANATRLLLLADKVLKFSRQHGGVLSDLAEDLFSQALLEDFSNAEINYKIGSACWDQQDYRRAAPYFVRSLRLRPWPESGPRCYEELGIVLEKSGKRDDAVTVYKEGIAKYPNEAGRVWDALSIHYYRAGNYIEAAVASRKAVRAFGDRGTVMNEEYKQARLRLSADDLVQLKIREDAIPEEFQKLKDVADRAREAGTPFVTKECERLIRDYEGATREFSPSTESRTSASKRARKLDPWEGLDPGTWFRFKATIGDAERFEDLGLKSREGEDPVLTVQSGKEGHVSAVQDVPCRSSTVWVLGEETLKFQTRSFQCEIRCPLNDDGTPKTDERTWVVKGAGYGAGAVLKVESPARTLVAKSVWAQTLKIKRREFNCVVVESESKSGETTTSLKAWYCPGIPRPLRTETDEESVVLVDFGSDWSERPAFPNAGAGPKK